MAGREKTVSLLDNVKELGFKYATEAGLTVSIDQMSEASLVT